MTPSDSGKGGEDMGNVSDGYHTFNELYDHRIALYIALARAFPDFAWKSETHEDGKGLPGWFIMGMELPGIGQVSYHLPMRFWNDIAVKALDRGLKWDGHAPKDVVDRLLKFNLRAHIDKGWVSRKEFDDLASRWKEDFEKRVELEDQMKGLRRVAGDLAKFIRDRRDREKENCAWVGDYDEALSAFDAWAKQRQEKT